MGSSHILDQLDTCFDDTHAVANAGLLLPATLAERLGIEQAADQVIDLGERAGAYRPGRKLLTLVHAMLAGGDCIDDADLLRCGQTASVLGHRVMAPSTLGTFLRSFTFGHVRQLDRLAEQVLARAWAAGAGPGDGPMTMDLDSTVCQVHGYHKQGAAYGYTHTLGYHPLVATRADSGEVLLCAWHLHPQVDDPVKALGVDSGISKSEVSRTCAKLDAEVATFRSRSLSHTSFPYVFLDASYLKARVDGRVVSPTVVIATGVTADMRPVLQLRLVRSPDAGTAVADHHDQPDAELDHAKQRLKGHIPGWRVRGQDPGELQHGCRYPQHAEQERDQDQPERPAPPPHHPYCQ
jgi:hypothetical protein